MTVSSVYGFGVFLGRTYGRLYGLPPPAIRSRADFCGRFNLGISLFDFACDEARGDARAALRRLPSLGPFTGTAEEGSVQDPTLRFLDRVAASVLSELSRELGPPRPARCPLWRAMFAMFQAQLTRAEDTRLADADDGMRAALRLTSAEPFRVMSEWVARGARSPAVMARRAAAFGRSVGECYWLIDDARDVWDDLYAGRWNRFLLDAKAAEPALRLGQPTPFLEARLMDIWRRERTAERAARSAVGRVARTLAALPVSRRRARAPLAQLHAAMRSWYG